MWSCLPSGKRPVAGYSLIETLVSMALTLVVGGAMVGLLTGGHHVFRDQDLLMEMNQVSRAVASMIVRDLRAAGQAVPVMAGRYEPVPSEAVQVFLPGTEADQVRVRLNLNAPEARLSETEPLTFDLLTDTWIQLDAQTLPKPGGFVFLSGQSNEVWTWLRARVDEVAPPDKLLVTPVQISSEGGFLPSGARVSYESAVSYQLSGGSVRRGEPKDLSSLAEPLFQLSSLGENFTRLEFSYYDGSGGQLDPRSPVDRSRIRRVDFLLQAETSAPLTDGSRGLDTISMSVRPPNLAPR